MLELTKNTCKQYRQFSIAIMCLLFFMPKTTFSQSETDLMLPPLDSLIKLALKNSPMLKAQDNWIETQRMEWDLTKKNWANFVSIGGTALLGTNTVVSYSESAIGSDQVAVDGRSAVYNGGLVVRFSLGDVLNQDEKEHIKILEFEKAQLDRKSMEQTIREEMIIRYNHFLSSYKMIELEVQNVEAMRVSFQVAKEYFEAGNYPINEYNAMQSKFIAAQKTLKQTQQEARLKHRLVLELAGVKS